MTNEKVIEYLNDIKYITNSVIHNADERENVQEALNKSIKALEQTKWIPCAERLPEKAEARYWICTDGGYQCQCRWTNNVYGLGEGDRWAWKIFDIPQFSKVVAWMPLPSSYQGESEGEK